MTTLKKGNLKVFALKLDRSPVCTNYPYLTFSQFFANATNQYKHADQQLPQAT